MINKRISKIYWAVAYAGGVLSIGFFSSTAFAACKVSADESTLSQSIEFGSVAVQRDAPIGSVIASKVTAPYHGGANFVMCTTDWVYRWESTLFHNISGLGAKIYNTNIDGVGIRAHVDGYYSIPNDMKAPPNSSAGVPNGMRLELIKTKAGAVGAGELTTGTLARASVAGVMWLANVKLTGRNAIIPVACSVTNTSISVPMGDVQKTLFTGPGSVVAEREFSIPLNCDANTKVNITLDGARDSSGVDGVLSLDPAAPETVAQGLGLQLLFNNVPVRLGDPLAVGIVPSDGAYSVPLAARYYQTGATVSEGKANSTASFTMTYN